MDSWRLIRARLVASPMPREGPALPTGIAAAGGSAKPALPGAENPLERIADRGADALRAARTEDGVGLNEIEVGFRTNEEVAVHVDLHPHADMFEKMIAAGVIGAGNEVAIVLAAVESGALGTDSRHGLNPQGFPDPPRIDPVDVIKDWAERLVAFVEVLFESPGDFTADAEVMAEEKINTEGRKEAASDRLRCITASRAAGWR